MPTNLPAPTTDEDKPSLFDGVLEDRHLKWAMAYVGEANFNATQAAIIAGYPKRSAHVRGHEVKHRKDVRERVEAHLAEYAMTQNEWLYQTAAVARMPLDAFVTIIATDKDGNPIAAKMDASAKMKGLELLGKANGSLTEKVQLDIKSVDIHLNGIDLDRLGVKLDDVIDADGEVK